ncbi:MAG: flagellar protein FlgN [Planctomycetes bacterium]|nr:flagellar protein FlgN [Planctomycetota bacterium]
MKDLLENLYDTLYQMAVTYNQILETAEEKQGYIISGDLDSLESVIFLERNLAESLVLLEEKRRYIMQSVCQEIGQCEETLSLQRLIEQLQDPYRSKLQEKRDLLYEITRKVQDISNVNASLSRYSLEYVNGLIKSLCSQPLDNTIYQQSGRVREENLDQVVFEVSA